MSGLDVEKISGSAEFLNSLGQGLKSNPASDKRVLDEMGAQGMAMPNPVSPTTDGNSVTFGKMLEQSLTQVNEHQVEADRGIKEMIAGRTKNPHETMLLIERADASLKMAMQVRNKILDAYREIMRMQV